MEVTRGGFLKMMSLAAGLGAVGSPELMAAPESQADLLDSQRFRRAVQKGDEATVRGYLEKDPALALGRDEKGRSMLVLAWMAGQQEMAGLLGERIAATAGLDLVEAVALGDMKRIGALTEKLPGLVNEPHPFGGTAVHAAVRSGRPAVLFALLGPGPDFNAPSSDPPGLTPYRMAVEFPRPETAEELVDAIAGNGGDPNAPQGDGVPLLHAAAAAGLLDSIRLLVLNGADINARNAAGETALEVALRKGNRAAADLLRKADRLPRNHRTSRFAYAAGGEKFERQDAPPLPQWVTNRFVSVSHGNLAAMRELLATYPSLTNVNASWDELGVEAGAHVGFKDGVQFLLDQGAPLSVCTAAMMGRADRVKALLTEDPLRIWDHGAHNMPPMWFPAIGGGQADHLESARLLLDAGADVNAHKRGQTALHWAARGGQVEMVDLLLSRGADANAPMMGDGATPLALAEKRGHGSIVERLRKAGAKA